MNQLLNMRLDDDVVIIFGSDTNLLHTLILSDDVEIFSNISGEEYLMSVDCIQYSLSQLTTLLIDALNHTLILHPSIIEPHH
jgi:hypothetical protein